MKRGLLFPLLGHAATGDAVHGEGVEGGRADEISAHTKGAFRVRVLRRGADHLAESLVGNEGVLVIAALVLQAGELQRGVGQGDGQYGILLLANLVGIHFLAVLMAFHEIADAVLIRAYGL